MINDDKPAGKEPANQHISDELVCGIIMPISGNLNEGYSEKHWDKVKDIIERAARKAKFNPQLVSDSDPTSIIQNNIINNIYYNQIVVCDVSSKNPNVMFELGLRLAFDKPVVIVKDNETNYTFDIGMIQHLTYPKSLDFHEMEKFIENLSKKIDDTYKNYQENRKEHSFLSHFGNLEPQKLNSKTIDIKEIVSMLTNNNEMLRRDISRIYRILSVIEQRNLEEINNQQDARRTSDDRLSRVIVRRRPPSLVNLEEAPF